MTTLVPTGRGSFAKAGTISLAEMLRRFDMAEGHRTMTREAVVAAFMAYHPAQP